MHAFGFVDAGVANTAPVAPAFLMVGSTFDDAKNFVNLNDFEMTITLAAWVVGGGSGFTWLSPSPTVIAPRGLVSLRAHYTGIAASFNTGTATITWSVAGGASGSVIATIEHDNGA